MTEKLSVYKPSSWIVYHVFKTLFAVLFDKLTSSLCFCLLAWKTRMGVCLSKSFLKPPTRNCIIWSSLIHVLYCLRYIRRPNIPTNEHLFFASLLLLKQSRPISDLTFVPQAIQLMLKFSNANETRNFYDYCQFSDLHTQPNGSNLYCFGHD